MHPDLERLVRLQDLELGVERARAAIAAMPARLAELDTQLAERTEAVSQATERLAGNQTARRALEKDFAAAQARLAKFKDQLMEVKTNKEYQAMQKEIASAEHDVRSIEDKILENLLLNDERADELKRAEEELAAAQTAAAAERRALERERQELDREIDRAVEERGCLVAEIDPTAMARYEQVARARKGIAVSEARNGHCSICHVRLRPQVYNDIRRNDSIIQCESCHRILYFAGTAVPDVQQA